MRKSPTACLNESRLKNIGCAPRTYRHKAVHGTRPTAITVQHRGVMIFNELLIQDTSDLACEEPGVYLRPARFLEL